MFIFNEPHANEMENTPQKNQPPEALGRRAQRPRLSGLHGVQNRPVVEGACDRVCPPTPGSQLQHPAAVGEGSCWEGRTVPVDGVPEGR